METCWEIHSKPKNFGKSNVATSSSDYERGGTLPKNSPTLGTLALQLLNPKQFKFAKLQEEIKALRNVLSHSSFANTSEYFARCTSITLTSIPSSQP